MSLFLTPTGSSFPSFCKRTIKTTRRPKVAGRGCAERRWEMPARRPRDPAGGHSLQRPVSAKHLTWAPGPSAFRCWALLSANTTWHPRLGTHPDARARPAEPTARGPALRPPGPPLPPRSHSLSRRRRLIAGSPRRFRSK